MRHNSPKFKAASNAMLNRPGFNTVAAISWAIEIAENGHSYYDSINISDCSKVISLDFNFENEFEYNNSIHKIDTLMTQLKAFKRALIAARKVKIKVDKEIKEKLAKEANNT
jgi:hypothetical protein